jgi:O-acetyl-ADP-ribose deacetylase (regulator of RNase III)
MGGIQYQKGNIFESSAQVIVNTVNCEGFMGKGLALAFKQRYPEMFSVYQQQCKSGELRIGRPRLYRESNPWILNFPTKNKWRANSKIEYLEKGLKYFVANYKEAGIKSIAFPKLGTQNGKLSWDEVGPLMAKYLSKLDIDVYIYIAEGDKEYLAEDNAAEVAAWKYFNELALSPEWLQQEVHLSPREAKKVAERRATTEFTSVSDIEAINGLAKVSLQRIKTFLHHQQYSANELPGITCEKRPAQRKKKSRAQSAPPKRKRVAPQAEYANAAPLFSTFEVIG